ncbi:Uncharacterised protein [Mycobacteroides abscessus subsp. abscessus]|nr:Uncharacterised protein [Mycobacteroides abscessus subsp. abscessus]
MCSDHPEGSVFAFHVNAAPGHDRARPHHEVVPRVARPALRLEQFGKALVAQALRDRVHGMERGRRSVDELAKSYCGRGHASHDG